MRKRLEQNGRLGWLQGDFKNLVNPENYALNARDRFRRLKKSTQLNRRQLSAAREVAAWREERAEALDLPRKWVLADEQIVEACRRETRTIDQLFLIRGMREKIGLTDARQIVRLIAKGLDLPEDEWPQTQRKGKNERNVDNEVDLMMTLVRKRAKENDIALQTLANHDSLQAIARGHYEDVDLLEGWRYDMIGHELLDLLDGKIALSIKNHHVHVTKL